MAKVGKTHNLSSDTRNACEMIHPAIMPFLDHCFVNKTLNSQGGILEVSKAKNRFVSFSS